MTLLQGRRRNKRNKTLLKDSRGNRALLKGNMGNRTLRLVIEW